MKSINPLREEINRIDEKILNLIRERAKISLGIGKAKKLSKTPILDKNREKEIIKKLKTPYEIQIFKKIISESRKLQ
ncbi:chorismate mutase [Candidatus Peregrinibacteria bacterium CG_4_10_14_0_2_um_filter_38_24]|nr:MAG: chorismate mutase [Candidatus Peregrinibacteria bacterium CG_4_10_14_0_2_um_filter_38_24]PJC39333.1 MAG: chorismate mutase [Candidatus Peregrinibacteria bacterium CG_4_9_14_0_2_um_filter_38_9]